MSEEVRFVITTIMEKEDYRKFLYTATFRRSPVMIPILGFISLLGAILLCGRKEDWK